MKLYGVNGYNLEIKFKKFDSKSFEEITGIKFIGESNDCSFIIDVENHRKEKEIEILTNIFLSEANQLINWFEQLKYTQISESKISIYHNQLDFELIKNDNKNNNKEIHIIYDSSIPISGNGGYSGEKVATNYIIKCIINDSELSKLILDLKYELSKL